METPNKTKTWLAVIAVGTGAALLAWQALKPDASHDGLASGNGRIEATEIDIATKTPGRVASIRVDEGDFVSAGQILAEMDTAVLDAQRREAEAQLRRVLIGVDIAQSQVVQREAERAAALALVAQRQAEGSAAKKRFARSVQLAAKGTTPIQTLDDDRAKTQGAQAAISAAQAQVAAADAAIGTAKAQVIGAQSAVEAARATLERIMADIEDSALKAPRDARVQYRVAQPGEVLPAGGRVLSLVDLSDVYMTFFLPTAAAGKVALGAEVRLVLDALPQHVMPARATFVADVAQFTPKTVETAEERLKLMFRIKARIEPLLLQKYIQHVKTGLPGMAYVRLDPKVDWPVHLEVTLRP